MGEKKGNRISQHTGKRLPSRPAIQNGVKLLHRQLRILQLQWKEFPFNGELDIEIKNEGEEE